ncbi:LysM peptidoglycan-binding domain-containing protein [Heyndrickxia acidicola]|uniref:LysM peptidoglycan-binding domain-containing protein n=1 Tax=Heyndrickxia acidicola TaxID=209389 RepID=A0ABU6MFV8_9BACI|nr:peptidoglycan endopeptidase [Heyndrickxia acidicola]MED1203298.1 LysM peptidoglycan-binding domain-containing protein [Heyndrickxia acidicola]
MKKTILSVAATTLMASGFTGQAFAATYKVQSGDSLYTISKKYGTTIQELRNWNHLNSDVLYPMQILTVQQTSSSVSKPAASVKTYKVKSGDTLSAIALKYSVTVAQLKSWNKLSSDLIHIGDTLKISGSAAASSSTASIASTKTAPASSAKTYKVTSGDSLSKIASKFKVTVAQLNSWNQLKTDVIKIGQVLNVASPAAVPASPVTTTGGSSKPAAPPATGQTGIYVVKSGDSLSVIAKNAGMSVADLKKLNTLTSDNIYAGQKLIVSNSTTIAQTPPSSGKGTISSPPPTGSGQTSASTASFSVDKLISAAKGVIGTPYVWGGSTQSGFDCSGFIYYAYNKAGYQVSRMSSDSYYSRSSYVTKPQPGDLVFFEGTYQSGISHLGIYLGNQQFIHAGDNGVEISSLDNSYWKSHFDSFKRFYDLQ